MRAQLVNQRGGADVVFDAEGRRTGGSRLLAVVTLKPGEHRRCYRLPTDADYHAVWKVQRRLHNILGAWEGGGREGPCPVPDEPLPPIGTLGFRIQRYGMLQWGDMFTARQKIALMTFAKAIAHQECTALALALGKLADLATSGCLWHTNNECPNQVLTTGRVRPFWDFAEGVPTADSSGSFQVCVDKLAGGIQSAEVGNTIGDLGMFAAQQSRLGNESADIWFTDPPYYDAIAYADLSDFFFVWLKRALPGHLLLRDPYDKRNPLTPKEYEAVQDETKQVNGRPKDRSFFEELMTRAFAEGRRVLRDDGVGCVVFAHKTTEGWEALLSGMIRSGWVVSGSWPIATEMTTRLRARDSAALATSVHLVCRPRTEDFTGDWGEVLRELPKRVGDWMARLEGEGVRGADLVFACIGPALEIFSRYAKVETPDGNEKTLAEYLEKVWEVVGRVALEQVLGSPEAQARNGGAGALEEDARLTALFLWTVQATDDQADDAPERDEDETLDDEDEEAAPSKKKPGFTLIYDVALRFAQPLGIHLSEWEGRIIETKRGVVRLLPVRERSQQLFGEAGEELAADRIERVARGAEQLDLFSAAGLVDAAVPDITPKRGRKKAGVADEALKTRREATTLDRVHAAMLLQAGGRANALRSLLKSETDRSPDFLRLANSLSALYRKESEEKRLLDAMLLAAPR